MYVPAEQDGAPLSAQVLDLQHLSVVHDPDVQSIVRRLSRARFCPIEQNEGVETSSSSQVLNGSQQSLTMHVSDEHVIWSLLGLAAKPLSLQAVLAIESQVGYETSMQQLGWSAEVHWPSHRVESSTPTLPDPQKVGLSSIQSLHLGLACSEQQSSQLFKLSLSVSGQFPQENPGHAVDAALAFFDAPQCSSKLLIDAQVSGLQQSAALHVLVLHVRSSP